MFSSRGAGGFAVSRGRGNRRASRRCGGGSVRAVSVCVSLFSSFPFAPFSVLPERLVRFSRPRRRPPPAPATEVSRGGSRPVLPSGIGMRRGRSRSLPIPGGEPRSAPSRIMDEVFFFFFAGETGCVKIKQKTRKRRSSAELLGCDALPSCLFFFSSPHFAHSSGPTASPLSPSRERGGRIINIEALPSPGGSSRAGAARVTRRPRLLVATHPRVAVVAPRAPLCSPSAQYRDLALSGVAGAVAGCRMRPVLVWDFWLLKTVTNSKKSLPGGLTPSVRPQPLCSQGIASLEMVVVDFFFFFVCVCLLAREIAAAPGPGGLCGPGWIAGCGAAGLCSPPRACCGAPLLRLNEKFNPIKKLNLVCLK